MRLYTPSFSVFYHRVSSLLRQMILLFFIASILGCARQVNEPAKAVGFVSVSEDNIAKVGEKIFQNGGNAADAMSAMLMEGSVSLPSRMGLGAGGICQVLDPSSGHVKTLDFLSRPMSFDYQIGVPALVKGVYTLQNKYGRKPWAEILDNPIQKAQNGIKISETLAKDILTASGLDSSWKSLKKGDVLKQPKLAKTLKALASSGAGALYKGELAEAIVSQSEQIILENLKNFKVSFMDSIDVSDAVGKTYFPNPTILSSDGYMIWRNAQSIQGKRQEQAQKDMEKLENSFSDIHVQGVSLASADTSGLVITCNVSMGNVFGSSQLTEQGFYLGQTIKYQDMPAIFANILQTNPDITDMTKIILSVGNYALVDALNYFSLTVNEKFLLNLSDNEERMEKLNFISCEKGYPNHASSCLENENLHFIYPKID